MKHYPKYKYINIPDLLKDENGNLILTDNNEAIQTGRVTVELNEFALHGNFLKLNLLYYMTGQNNLKQSLLRYPYCLTQQVPFEQLRSDITTWSNEYNRLVLKTSWSYNGKWSGLKQSALRYIYNGWEETDTYVV